MGGATLGRSILSAMAALVATMGPAWSAPPDSSQPTVEWLIWDALPFHMAEGSQFVGAEDELVDWLIARLPGYDHMREFVSTESREEMLKTRDRVCAVGYFKTRERATYAQFTDTPAFTTSPARLIVPAQSVARFDKFRDRTGRVDLVALVADRSFSGGRQADRSYTPLIDTLLRPVAATGSLTTWVDVRSGFRMLAAGRIDWLIDYPEAAALALAEAPLSFRYQVLPISGADELRPSYVACSKMPGGIALAADIDRLLAAAGPHPPWQANYEDWLDPERQTALRQILAHRAASVATPR